MPNILLIISDDERYGCVPLAPMPNVQAQFIDLGRKFTNAWATTPLCNVSRCSIYSGRHAHEHGIPTNDGNGFDDWNTWVRVLKQAGYRTGIVGKYLNAVAVGTAPNFDTKTAIAEDALTEPDDIVAAFNSFVSTAPAGPWCYVIAAHSPHSPYTVQPHSADPVQPWVPQPSDASLADKHPDVALHQVSNTFHQSVYEAQMLELQALDEAIGSVFATINANSLRGSTLALYLADNGLLWGDHGLGNKGWPYIGCCQLPLYATWPGHISYPTEDSKLRANVDIAPTILNAAGLTADFPLSGGDILEHKIREELLLEYMVPEIGVHQAWRTYFRPGLRWYTEYGDGFIEDYDLGADPTQLYAKNTSDYLIQAWLDDAQGGTW